MASQKRVHAVLLTQSDSEQSAVDDTKFSVRMSPVKFPENELDHPSWTLCTFCERIGLPLKTGGLDESPKSADKWAARLLCVESHPDQKSFGGSHTKPDREAIVVARCDGGVLEPPLVHTVLGFIQKFRKSAAPLVGKMDEESLVAKKQLAATVNPEAFKEFFETIGKQEAMKILSPDYTDAILPDPTQGKFCRSCGTAEREGKAKLLGCGGCNEVYYCDKKC